MPRTPIPFNRPLFLERGLDYVRQAYQRGHVSGDGKYTLLCQDFFQKEIGASKALLTTSCTDALEMCSLLLDLKPGDEVVVTDFTFVSTANAFVLRGAKPVFVDIRPDTLNLDEKLLSEALTPRTKAIVVVHYAGVGCAMDAVCGFSKRHGLSLVEDNAHGLFGRFQGRPLGSFGDFATLSFHETKNLSCGEGGALIVNNAKYSERAEILREKGTDRSKFFRGEIDKYSWRDIGSSFLPADILAALLWSQIECHGEIQAQRRKVYRRYEKFLGSWAREQGVQIPAIPSDCEASYHMFYLLMPTAGARHRFIAAMRDQGIGAVFHYQPLHLTPMGRILGGKPGQCPVSEAASERIVRLPFYFDLDPSDQDRIVDSVLAFSA